MRLLHAATLALSLGLTACGGGGGGGPVAQQSAEGIWVGSTTSNGSTPSPAIGLILDTGEYFFGTGTGYSGVTFGTSSVSGATISSTNMKSEYSGSLINGNFTGTVKTGSSIDISIAEIYNGTTYTATGNFSFDTRYNEPSSLATIAGNYVSPSAFSSSYTYTVDANGVLTGASTQCTFNGQLSVRNSTKNIYNLSITTGNVLGQTCPVGARTFQGAATYTVMPNRTARSLVLIALTSTGSYYYWITAAGEKQ